MPISKIKQNSFETDVTPIGVGQTWTNVSGSRATGTTYFNTTGRPIQVNVVFNAGATTTCTLTVNSILVGSTNVVTNMPQTLVAIVPSGGSYVTAGTSVNNWAELR